MRKITVALALVLVVALAAPAVQGETFPDVDEDHWAYEAVEALVAAGVVEGYPDGEYKGDQTMTRYEMAMIIQRTLDNINEEFERVDQDIMYLEEDISELEDGLTAAQAEDVVAIVERMMEDEIGPQDELSEGQAEQVTEIVEAMVAEFDEELEQLEAELGALRYVIETQTDALWAETDDIQDTIDALDARVEDLEEEEPAVEFWADYGIHYKHEDFVDLGDAGFITADDHDLEDWTLAVTGTPEVPVEQWALDAEDFEVNPADYTASEGYITDLYDFAEWVAAELEARMVETEPGDDGTSTDSFAAYAVDLAQDIQDDIAPNGTGILATHDFDVADTTTGVIDSGAGGFEEAWRIDYFSIWDGVEEESGDIDDFFLEEQGFTHELTVGADANRDAFDASLELTLLQKRTPIAGIFAPDPIDTSTDLDIEDAMLNIQTENLDLTYETEPALDIADFAAHGDANAPFAIPAYEQGVTAEFLGTEAFFIQTEDTSGDDSVDLSPSFSESYEDDDFADWDDEAENMVDVDYSHTGYLFGAQRGFEFGDLSLDVTGAAETGHTNWLHENNSLVFGAESEFDLDGIELGGDVAVSSDMRFGDIGTFVRGSASTELEGLAELSGNARWASDFEPIRGSDIFGDASDYEDGVVNDEIGAFFRVDQDLTDFLEEGYFEFGYLAEDMKLTAGGEVEPIENLTLDAEASQERYTEEWFGVPVFGEEGESYDFADNTVELGAEYEFNDLFTFGLGYELEMHADADDQLLDDIVEEYDGYVGYVEPGIWRTPDWEDYWEDWDDSLDDKQTIDVSADVEGFEVFDDLELGAGVSYEMVTGQDYLPAPAEETRFAIDSPELPWAVYDIDRTTIGVSGDAQYELGNSTFSNEISADLMSGTYYDFFAERGINELEAEFTEVDEFYDGESGDRTLISNTFSYSYDIGEDVDAYVDWTEEWLRFDDDILSDYFDYQSREVAAGVEISF